MHLKLAQVKNPADPLKEKLLKIVEKLQNDLAEVKKENAELKVKIGDLTMELGKTKMQVKLAYFFKMSFEIFITIFFLHSWII